MATKNNNPERRRAWIIDNRTGERKGTMNGKELAACFPNREDLKYYSILCTGETKGNICNCPMYLSQRNGTIPYLVVKKNYRHIKDCPNGSFELRKFREELTDVIESNPALFLAEILSTKNKKYLPKVIVTSSNNEDKKSILTASKEPVELIRENRANIKKAIEGSEFSSDIDYDDIEQEESFELSGSGDFETLDGKHHEKHEILRRKPKSITELLIQFFLFADLTDYVYNSDYRYHDIMLLPETKGIFRDFKNTMGYEAFMLCTKPWSRDIENLVKNDEGVCLNLNPAGYPSVVLEDPFKTSWYWDSVKKKNIFRNEERIIFLLTFENTEEKKKYIDKYIGAYKLNKKNGRSSWRKSKFLKTPRLVLANWDSTYDGFVDPNGNKRKIVHAHINNTSKQISVFRDKDIFEEIFGEE